MDDLLLARSNIPSWGQVDRHVWKLIRRYAHGRVLDAGCARGWYVKVLQEHGYDAYGCDLMDWPEWHSNIRQPFVRSDLLHLPFEDQSFDTVMCLNVLEHISPIRSTLHELNRVCKNGGSLILTVPNCDNPKEMGLSGLTYHHWIDRSHVHFFLEQDFRSLLAQSGLQIQTLVKYGNIRPELLLLRSFRIPLIIARAITAGLQWIPGRRRFAPLLFAVVKSNH